MSNEPSYASLKKYGLVLVGIVLIALNLRIIITSVPPVLEMIRFDLDVGYAVVSLLTTIPIFLMGACSLQAVTVTRKLGLEQGIFWTVVLLAVATGMRVRGDLFWVLIGSTVLGGVALGVGQPMVSALVKRYFADRAATVMGFIVSGMNAGAAVASGLTVPITLMIGHWTWGLSIWVLPLGIALVGWIPVLIWANNRQPAVPELEESRAIPWNEPGAWLITLFFCCQALTYAGSITWIAPLYVSEGWSEEAAGYLLSLMMWVQLAGSVVIPPLADRFHDRRPWFGLTICMIGTGLVGMTFVPLASPWVWAGLVGLGLGGQFPLSLTLPLDYSDDPSMANRLSSMVFFVGYIVAAVGPFIMGGMLDWDFTYTATFLVLLLVVGCMFVLCLRFAPKLSLEELA